MKTDIVSDYFSLLGLPHRFTLDQQALEKAYRTAQAQVHPDRFINANNAERRIAMQWSTNVNEAYAVLTNPLKRAAYLLSLHGREAYAEKNNKATKPAFLVQQMEWYEAIAIARRSGQTEQLEDLHSRLTQELDNHYHQLARLLDGEIGNDALLDQATELIQQAMFLTKLLQEVDDALFEAIE